MIHFTPAEQAVLTLYTEGWTVRAIAEARGTTRWTVHSQIEAVRARLRKQGHDCRNKIRLTQALKKETT